MSLFSIVELHRLHADAVARQLLLEGLLALALDGEHDVGADLAAHLVDGLVQRHALDFGAVDLGDQVVGHDAGALGGRIVDGRDHLDHAVLHRHFDAEPAEFAAGLDAHVLELLLVHVARMRIERGQHAVDRRLDHLALVGLLPHSPPARGRTRRRTGSAACRYRHWTPPPPRRRRATAARRTPHPPTTRPKFCNREFFIIHAPLSNRRSTRDRNQRPLCCS